MKKIIIAISLLFFLCGCSEERDISLDVNKHYEEINLFSCTATITANQDARLMTYTLAYNYDKIAEDLVIVLAPNEIAGISMAIDDNYTLSFDDKVLEMNMPILKGATPADMITGIIDTLKTSTASEISTERIDDKVTNRLTYICEPFIKTIWLDDNLYPLKAEIFNDNVCILSAVFTEYIES